MKRLGLLSLLLLTGCATHRMPHFAQRQCVAGTVEVNYRYCPTGQPCAIVDGCQMIEKVIVNPKDGRKLTVLSRNMYLLAKGEDPNDTDGDETGAPEKPQTHHWWRRDAKPDND